MANAKALADLNAPPEERDARPTTGRAGKSVWKEGDRKVLDGRTATVEEIASFGVPIVRT